MHRPKLFFYLFTVFAILILAIAGTVALSSIQKDTERAEQEGNIPKNLIFSRQAAIKGTPLYLAIARTNLEQMTGLSFQKELQGDHGLLFIFSSPRRGGIWMKDMNFPIDVLWLDSDMRVIFIKNNFLPESYPEIIYPTMDASFVLEVSSGFALKHQINIGDVLKVSQKME